MAEKKNPDPFDNLPRRSLFGDDVASSKKVNRDEKEIAVKRLQESSLVASAPKVAPIEKSVVGRSGQSAKTSTVLHDESKGSMGDTKKSIGRPKIVGEPWILAGMSKRTWYRRQKKDSGK